MTRFLSEALQAEEPAFRLGLQRLESANGHPAADIRFSSEVARASRAKISQLGLDPRDTTAEELYHVLQARVKADDARLTKALRTRAATHISAEADLMAGMIHALKGLPDSKRCFALKLSVLKTLVKKNPPKKAMKQLGYRSLESFVKHESPVLLLAAAWLTEGPAWQRRLLDQYASLRPSDFEERAIALLRPDSERWRHLAERTVSRQRHNLLSFKELGAIVFLPLRSDAPAGTTTVSLSLALHELNEIRACGTFLKLCLVRPDFGVLVRSIVSEEPRLHSQLLDQSMPWHLVQRYYARLKRHAHEEAFEPHLQLEDMVWYPIERALSAIEPSFDFWRRSAHLGLLYDKQPVSFNVIDAALNCCNQLPFERRVAQYFQRSLWHELLLRYLRHEPVEKAIIAELQPELATETVTA